MATYGPTELTTTPIPLVATLGLTNGAEYYLENTGREVGTFVGIFFGGAAAPATDTVLLYSTKIYNGDPPRKITVKASEEIWVWASFGKTYLVVTDV